MAFVLPDNFIISLCKLRKDYEKDTTADLEKTSQPYAISLFFGAKNIESRKKQIAFIEQWIAVFKDDLSITNTESPEAMQQHLTALRVLMAVVFYIESQIKETYIVRSGSSSVLEKLISEAMGISRDNVIDDETRASCLLAAKRYLSETGRFETINANLHSHFTEKQWDHFSCYLIEQCKTLNKSAYPITSMMMPLFSKPMEVVGSSTGYLMGDMIGKSNRVLPTRYALTAVIATSLFSIMGPSSSIGAMLIAGPVLDTFFGLSSAWVMGSALSVVGKGVGFGVGMSLDLSWKLLYNACSVLGGIYRTYPKLTGTSLIDGHRISEGVDLKYEDITKLSEKFLTDSAENPIELTVDDTGYTITMNGQSVKFPWLDIKQPQIEELKKVFSHDVSPPSYSEAMTPSISMG